MKRTVIALLALLCFQVAAWSQAAKPTVMVYPSDQYCKEKGYVTKIMRDGMVQEVPDIKRVITDDADMRAAIRAIGSFMSDNGFPLTDLEMELNAANDDDMLFSAAQGKNGGSAMEESPMELILRQAKPDIFLTVEMHSVRVGPRTKINFALDAFDSATHKRIDGVQNAEGSEGSNVASLIIEGVLAVKDKFLGSLQAHFDDMFANGREVTVQLRRMDSWDDDFETEFEYNGDEYELCDIIRTWMNKNTVQKRYTVKTKTANKLEYTQVRIPMYTTDADGDQMAMTAEDFGKQLAKFIRKQTGLKQVGVIPRGLGNVILFVGEKVN